MLRKILTFVVGKPLPSLPVSRQQQASRRAAKERELMRREAKIGAAVFGPIPAGHTRKFFCLDATTWIWHEQWRDTASGQPRGSYVTYEFQPRGVLKTANGTIKGYVGDVELERLLDAISLYHKRVTTELYSATLPAVA